MGDRARGGRERHSQCGVRAGEIAGLGLSPGGEGGGLAEGTRLRGSQAPSSARNPLREGSS